MKTILDAVNTLKGVWPSESIQIIEIDGVEFSEKEFIICVVGCSNNFGLPSFTAKPVYTQAMYDDNKLPAIGMLCKHKGVNKSVIAPLDVNNKLVLISIYNGIYSLAHCNDIEPIDSRTPKQKADDLFKLYLKGEQVSTHKSFSQAAIDGDFGDNIKWVK